ncbi:MAG: hypothetical protein Kow0069_02960 [Promethearchaeota archaeon]
MELVSCGAFLGSFAVFSAKGNRSDKNFDPTLGPAEVVRDVRERAKRGERRGMFSHRGLRVVFVHRALEVDSPLPWPAAVYVVTKKKPKGSTLEQVWEVLNGLLDSMLAGLPPGAHQDEAFLLVRDLKGRAEEWGVKAVEALGGVGK